MLTDDHFHNYTKKCTYKEQWENTLELQNNPGGACTNLSQSQACLKTPSQCLVIKI